MEKKKELKERVRAVIIKGAKKQEDKRDGGGKKERKVKICSSYLNCRHCEQEPLIQKESTFFIRWPRGINSNFNLYL